MQLASHLRLSRCGVYQFRIVLPVNVAALFGQRVIIRSLGTKRPEIARLVAYDISAKIMPLLRQLRRALAIDPNSINPKDIRELVISNMTIKRPDGTVVTADRIETSDDPVRANRELRSIERLIANQPDLPPVSEAKLKLMEEERAQFAAIVDESMNRNKQAVEREENLENAFLSFMRYKQGLAKTSQTTYRRRLNVFAGLAGGNQRLLHDIKPFEVSRICEALLVVSANARKVVDAETLLKAPPPQRKLAATTVKDYMILFGDFFDWAIGAKCYPELINPVRGLARPSEGNNGTGGGADPFLQSELETIFTPENFQSMKRPYQFWGPLLGLFTGARSNEIAQLRVWDVTHQDGILCISITNEPQHAVPTRTKNKSSVRVMPIHPRLLEIGFEDFWTDMKAVGTQRLFGLQASDDGKCERYLSRDFNEGLLVRVGVYKYRKRTFHSFRDTVSNTLGRAKVWGPFINHWLGHAQGTVQGEAYSKQLTSPEVMNEVIPALKYDFLDFSQIRYKRHEWDQWVASQLLPKEKKQPRVPEAEQNNLLAAKRAARKAAVVKAKTGRKS